MPPTYFSDSRGVIREIDPVLTTAARGYKQSGLIADKLFPLISAPKESFKTRVFGKSDFIVPGNMLFAPNQPRPARIAPAEHSLVSVDLQPYALEIPINKMDEEEDPLPRQMREARRLKRLFDLMVEKNAATLATDQANYANSNKKLCSSTTCWDDQEHSTPVKDVKTAKSAIRSQIGVEPNTMIIGVAALEVLVEHPAVLERIKYTKEAVVAVSDLAAIFGIPNIVVASAVQSSDAGVLSDVWGDNVVIAYVAQSAAPDEGEPSFGYTYVREGYPLFGQYAEGMLQTIIAGAMKYATKIQGAEAGYLITNVVA